MLNLKRMRDWYFKKEARIGPAVVAFWFQIIASRCFHMPLKWEFPHFNKVWSQEYWGHTILKNIYIKCFTVWNWINCLKWCHMKITSLKMKTRSPDVCSLLLICAWSQRLKATLASTKNQNYFAVTFFWCYVKTVSPNSPISHYYSELTEWIQHFVVFITSI